MTGRSLSALIPLLLIPLLIAGGQLLFKQASQSEGLVRGPLLVSLATNPFLFAALVVYLGASLWWVVVLRTAPLSYAYVFIALSFLYVPALAWILFGERFGWRAVLGFALILAGVALAVSDRPAGV